MPQAFDDIRICVFVFKTENLMSHPKTLHPFILAQRIVDTTVIPNMTKVVATTEQWGLLCYKCARSAINLPADSDNEFPLCAAQRPFIHISHAEL